MKKSTLWSLRLGYSGKQAAAIETAGIAQFLQHSFDAKWDGEIPEFLHGSPKTSEEIKASAKEMKNGDALQRKKLHQEDFETSWEMRSWWVDKMMSDPFPLREKMTCFWHNHYVSTYRKVKVNYWIYRHNMVLREHAFGNFRELTKKILQTNAMVRYLDNTDNKNPHYNENLSRELLELFTLGIGNYTEQDIKNGAKGLSGLGVGPEDAAYRPISESNDPFEYLGKKGNFKVTEMVDIIFEQPAVPYLLTRKILRWFLYDTPSEDLVRYYGNYFKTFDFEIKPLLVKIFTEEYAKDNAGSKIKDPLEYVIPLIEQLNISGPSPKAVAYFAMQQGMDLFNQPNVKGWDGGASWLTSQLYLQRNNVADILCSGRPLNRRYLGNQSDANPKIHLDWDKKGNNRQIIQALKDRVLFAADEELQAAFEQLLRHDFDPGAQGAENAVVRLFNAMAKTPEYQLI